MIEIINLFISFIGLEGKAAEISSFFIYDILKILFLLFFMITTIGFIRTYISLEKFRNYVSKKGIIGNFFASLFGALTPFCSCSSIPIFLSFIKSRMPLGVAFSFLITSPLINEYLVALMFGFFGLKITIVYIISGLLIGTIFGFIIGKMKIENLIEKDMKSKKIKNKKFKNKKERILFGINESYDIIKKIWLWLLIGVGIGSLIHNFVPESFFQSILETTGIFTLPLAVIIGVPIYGSCAAIVPIALALFQKGIPLGTALAFMMSVSALSLPEAVILRRALKLKLILLFFGIVTLSFILTGYLLNFIQIFL